MISTEEFYALIAVGERFELFTKDGQVVAVLPLAKEKVPMTHDEYAQWLDLHGYKVVPK